jgi:excinuclease ABC subunit B
VAGDEDIEFSDLESTVARIEKEMLEAASNMEFERAAELRDRMRELQDRMIMTGSPARTSSTSGSGKGKKKSRRGKNRKKLDWSRQGKAT